MELDTILELSLLPFLPLDCELCNIRSVLIISGHLVSNVLFHINGSLKIVKEMQGHRVSLILALRQ